MIVALLTVGALVAGVGTQASAAVFIAAAGLATASGALPALAAWTAVMAAGLVALQATPRRLVLPALGATAVIASGSVRNAAAVFGLWFLGTAAAVVAKGEGSGSDRWAAALCLADLPVLAAVSWTAFRGGFEGWPGQLDAVAVVLLLVATAARAPLCSGADDEAVEAGLLPVRTQAALLPLLAITGLAPESALLAVGAVVGSVGLVVGGLARRDATRDAIQEIALLVVVLTIASSGRGPAGWEWGVLAAGTLIHNLRLRVDESRPAGKLAGLLLAGGGLGLPLLPAVLVALEGAVRWSGWVGSAILLGGFGGLAARASRRSPTVEPSSAPDMGGSRWTWGSPVTVVVLGASFVAAFWAPVFTLPTAAGADTIDWPPLWAGVVILAAGAAGVLLAPPIDGHSTTGRGSSFPLRTIPLRTIPELRMPASWGQPRLVSAVVAALGVSALVVWAAGVVRGFL